MFVVLNVCFFFFVHAGGDHGRYGGGRLSSLPPQRAHVSNLSGHAEEHHDDQRVSAPLLLRLHRHCSAIRVIISTVIVTVRRNVR